MSATRSLEPGHFFQQQPELTENMMQLKKLEDSGFLQKAYAAYGVDR